MYVFRLCQLRLSAKALIGAVLAKVGAGHQRLRLWMGERGTWPAFADRPGEPHLALCPPSIVETVLDGSACMK